MSDVSEIVIEGEKSIAPIPERRKPPEEGERRGQMPATIPPPAPCVEMPRLRVLMCTGRTSWGLSDMQGEEGEV